MSSYAPLLAKDGRTQWNPDLIYFNNREVRPTTGYYVQKLYGQNAGDHYIPSQINKSAFFACSTIVGTGLVSVQYVTFNPFLAGPSTISGV